MAAYRREKLASGIRVILSEAIARQVNDPRIAPITSITRVELSPDYQFAKVFISVMGVEARQRATLAGLQHAQSHLQRILAKSLGVRTCPRISFEADASLKSAIQTLEVIREAREEWEDSAQNGDSGEPGTSGDEAEATRKPTSRPEMEQE